MAVEVTFVDRGLTVVRDRLRELGGLSLTIGFQGPSGAQLYPTGVNVATVALLQEFGTKTSSQRSFLRSTMFESRDRIERAMARAVELTLTDLNTSPVAALSVAGDAIARMVSRKIETSRGWAKRNRPSTIAKKGRDFPLHETDLMAKSVTWAVRRRGVIIEMAGV